MRFMYEKYSREGIVANWKRSSSLDVPSSRRLQAFRKLLHRHRTSPCTRLNPAIFPCVHQKKKNVTDLTQTSLHITSSYLRLSLLAGVQRRRARLDFGLHILLWEKRVLTKRGTSFTSNATLSLILIESRLSDRMYRTDTHSFRHRVTNYHNEDPSQHPAE